jgi:hypothetical protein
MLIFKKIIKKILRIFLINVNKINIFSTKNFLNKIFIYDCGYQLIRVGDKKDGGYLIPDILYKIKYCFSPGVGTNSSFEDNLKKFKIKSFLADGTVQYSGKHDFIKKNLNTFNDEKNITLEDWIRIKLKKKNSNNLILQMDIEGSEIGVIYNTRESVLKKFAILIIEFHDFNNICNNFGLKIYDEIFSKLLRNFTICHIHPNNTWGVTKICNIDVPNFMEFTFINNQYCKKKNIIKYSLPHINDYKNNKQVPEIKLSTFFYKKK